jgi:hypothetical protein
MLPHSFQATINPTSTMNLAQYGSNGATAAPPRCRFSREDDLVRPGETSECARPIIVVQHIDPVVVRESIQLSKDDKRTFEFAWFNSSNRHEFDPYEFNQLDNTLLVDTIWWQQQPKPLTDDIKTFLEERQVQLQLSGAFRCPHDEPRESCPVSNFCYSRFNDQFSFENFMHVVTAETRVVKLEW